MQAVLMLSLRDVPGSARVLSTYIGFRVGLVEGGLGRRATPSHEFSACMHVSMHVCILVPLAGTYAVVIEVCWKPC